MRVRFVLSQSVENRDGGDLFRGIPSSNPWGSVSFSGCMQAAIVWIGVSYLHFLAMLPPAVVIPVRQARVLDLNIDPIEFHPALPAPNVAADHSMKPKNRSKHSGQASSASASAGPTAPPAPAMAAREFRMPAVRPRQSAPQTLVQLDLPPTMDLRQQLRVPTLVILASTPRHLAPKPFIAPPERKNTMEPPSHVALEMRVPILDVRPGFAKTPEVLSELTPRLAAPVGAVAPVASTREPVEAKTAAATVTGKVPAEPINVISLPDRPIPGASSIVLPPLNQVSARDGASGTAGPLDPSGGKAQTGTSGRADAETVAGAKSLSTQSGTGGGTGSGVGTAGPAHGAASANLGAGGGNGTSGSAGNAALGHGTGAGAGTDGKLAGGGGDGHAGAGETGGAGAKPGAGAGPGGNGSAPNGPSKPVPLLKRLVRPREGGYEIAIVQSGGGVVPGSAGLLKGRPVYSVYIPVGAGKEWILQYCLPTEEGRGAAPSQVVQLGNVAPIAAPYAFTILGPVVRFLAGARYGFIHGFVNASGRFEHLTEASEPVMDNLDAILEALEQWEFRPAMKDGVPTVVEVLLCIPNAA